MTPPIASVGCRASLFTTGDQRGHTTEIPTAAIAEPAAATTGERTSASIASPAAARPPPVAIDRRGPSVATIGPPAKRAAVANAAPSDVRPDSREHAQAEVRPQVEHAPRRDAALDHRGRAEHRGQHDETLVPQPDDGVQHRRVLVAGRFGNVGAPA